MSNPKTIINGKWDIPTNLYEHDKINGNPPAPIHKAPIYFNYFCNIQKSLQPTSFSLINRLSDTILIPLQFALDFLAISNLIKFRTCWPCSWADCPPHPQNGVLDRLPGTRITGGKGICIKLCLSRGNGARNLWVFYKGWRKGNTDVYADQVLVEIVVD